MKIMKDQKLVMYFGGIFTYGICSGITMNFFYRPLAIGSTGIQGVSQVLVELAERGIHCHLPLGVIFLVLNIPLIALSWRYIGRYFTTFTLLSVAVSSVMLDLIPVILLTEDTFLGVFLGGLINGGGVGIALKCGVSSGGVDIIALLLKKKIDLEVGILSTVVNSIIIVAVAATFGWGRVLYTIFGTLISGYTMDRVFNNQQKVQVLIITDQSQQLMTEIQQRLFQGVTLLNEVEGGYSKQPKKILLTVISKGEVPQLQGIIKTYDPMAFLTITDQCQVTGNFIKKDFT